MRQDMGRLVAHGGRPGKQSEFIGRRVKLFDGEEPVQLGRTPIRPECRSWDVYGHTRHTPLKRFLMARVGRPWAEVYAEASTQYVPNMQRSVREWLTDNVSQNVFRNADDEFVFGTQYAGVREVSDNKFFVHPDTGLLCASGQQEGYRTQARLHRAEREAKAAQTRRIVSDTLQYHKRDGVWYEVAIANFEDFVPKSQHDYGWDSFLKQYPGYRYLADMTYGNPKLYATSHRTLSHKEIHNLGLA